MIRKPENWGKLIPNAGNFQKLPAGGYICRIAGVELIKSKTGKDMLKIIVDIERGKFKDYFFKRFLQDKERFENPRWGCVYYQVVEGDISLAIFKGIIENIEKSNPGYKWDWNEKSLVNKIFGGIFREEEFINRQGGVSSVMRLAYIRSTEKIEEVDPPHKKTINGGNIKPSDFGEEVVPF